MGNRSQDTTRARIKEHATELLILYGYRGLRFGDIAERMGITRGNVHYHFGTKSRLAEEVIVDYVEAALAELRAILCNPETGFAAKIEQLIDYCYRRYRRFNTEPEGGVPWSLVGRLRLEPDILSTRSRQVLGGFSSELKAATLNAIYNAKQKGEFVPDAPSEAMAAQLVAIIEYAPVLTQYSGGFRELAELYRGYLTLMNFNHAADAPAAGREASSGG
ncbi:MAG TPA: TetR/AcrR family transcriptional regulator [Arenicellales bacterium]|nr:TetR/AcrR family transcriptional regulator [Arenicellales bacterium]